MLPSLGHTQDNVILHRLASRRDRVEPLIRLVLRRQPLLINRVDDEGHTPLYKALRERAVNNVHLLLSLGADPLAMCEEIEDYNALQMAVVGGSCACAYAILSAVTQPDLRKWLLEHASSEEETALDLACKGHASDEAEAMVSLLLRAGADPNHAGPHGYTALHHALHSGHAPFVRALLDHGANASIKCPQHGPTTRCCGTDSMHQALAGNL